MRQNHDNPNDRLVYKTDDTLNGKRQELVRVEGNFYLNASLVTRQEAIEFLLKHKLAPKEIVKTLDRERS